MTDKIQTTTIFIGAHEVAIGWTDAGVRVGLFRDGEFIGAVNSFTGRSTELAGPLVNYRLARPSDRELVIELIKDDVTIQRVTLEVALRSATITKDEANYPRPEQN